MKDWKCPPEEQRPVATVYHKAEEYVDDPNVDPELRRVSAALIELVNNYYKLQHAYVKEKYG